MAEAKKKRIQITSPAGTFRFPKLNEPDHGTKDFPKPDGEYSVGLILKKDSPEFQKMEALLKSHYEAALDEAKAAFKEMKVEARKALEKKNIKGPVANPLYTEIYDKETEEPTGDVFFKFAMRASGVRKQGPKQGTKWTMKPAIFDAKGNYLAKAPAIWGGTRGKIAFEPSPYFIPGTAAAGLKLSLVGVQVIDLVSAGQRSAASMGFGEEEGYEYTPDTPSMPDETDGSAEDKEAGDF